MIIWLAAFFVVGGVVLALWAIKPEPGVVTVGVDPEDVILSSRAMELESSAKERIFAPAVAAMSNAARRYLPSGVLDKMAHTLKVADLDRKWSPEIVVGAQVIGFGLGIAFSMFYLGSSGVSRTNIMVSGLVVILFTMAPSTKVNRIADDRRKAITNELPDVLDQLKVTVEAGMSFDGALLRAGQEGRGLLATEMLKAVNDMQLGLSRGEALQALSDRTDVPDMKQFVNAVKQAEKHGFPLANILKLQALELRDRRRARAEEKAMQVPVKITFPLVFCILPALFIVILGPAAVNISSGF